MDGKLDVHRLVKEELSYELAVRGLPTDKTVEEMRRILRGFMRLEQSDTTVKWPSHPFDFAEDYAYLQDKLGEISDLVNQFKDFDSSSEFQKICAKLLHAFKRADRMVASDDSEVGKRSKLLVDLLNLRSGLASRARKVKRASQREDAPIEISALTIAGEETESEDSDSETTFEMSRNAAQSSPRQSGSAEHNKNKSIPVSKWNLTKFDGETGRVSLSAFLENVEELRLSRNVSKDQLFESASDLFAGKALIWFRSIRSTISGWQELVRELKLQFHPPNFNEKLLDEIKSRTQGADESMGIYLATMTNMFRRLTMSVSEAVKLKILLRNINPFYQSQLGLVAINSVKELLEFGRKLEARKESIESFKPPPRNRAALMEPDLAYVYADSLTSSTPQVDEVSIKCWRCQGMGHRAAKCNVPVSDRHCFRCGNPNYTVRSCPRCNTASGNGNRRS